MNPTIAPHDSNPDDLRRRNLARILAVIAIPVLLLFTGVTFYRGDRLQAGLNLFAVMLIVAALVRLPRSLQADYLYRAISLALFLLFTFDLIKGGAQGEMILWFYTWPLFIFFAHGKREGLAWLIPVVALLVLLLYWPPSFLAVYPYPDGFKTRFLFSFGIVAAMAYCFEATREAFHQKLIDEQQKLSAANQLLRGANSALQEANRRLQHEMVQRVRLERELKRASKMEAVGTLAGGVAHDLNNILSGIVSYPDLILMDLPPDSPLRTPVETIRDSGLKAATIVQDLLAMARRSIPAFERVDLNQLVERYLVSPEYLNLQRYHPLTNVATQFDPDLPPVAGSPVHLTKAVMNLVTNAAEAMPAGGIIQIATTSRSLDAPETAFETIPPGDYAVLTVSDIGQGIAKNDLDKVFEPFFSRKKLDRSGSGLGMNVVWATVKDHYGFINLQSTEGVGTRVDLLIPVSQEPPPAPSAPDLPAELMQGRGERILVVDDLREQREIASAMLRRMGYEVVTAASGEEALAQTEAAAFDLLLLDMIMDPGMDGLETLLRLRERCPQQRAIIASGYSETNRVEQALACGACIYLRKPYNMESLGRAVQQALSGSGAGRPAESSSPT
jgi:signal transduction histidine kinase/ActR/RegA family two-component response regulator